MKLFNILNGQFDILENHLTSYHVSSETLNLNIAKKTLLF